MDKKDIERRLEAAEKQNIGLLDEIKNLKEKLAEMQSEPEIPDMPYFGEGEKYWFIYNDLSTTDANSRFCGGSTKCFNAFHSKEIAQEFAEKCKLIAMMLHCKWHIDSGYVPDWNNDDERKFCVIFDHVKSKYVCGNPWGALEPVGVYFSSIHKAEKAADWLNEHWRKNDEESV